MCISILISILTVYADFHHESFHKDLKRPHKKFKLAFLTAEFPHHWHLFAHLDRTDLLTVPRDFISAFLLLLLGVSKKECQYVIVIRKTKEILNDL